MCKYLMVPLQTWPHDSGAHTSLSTKGEGHAGTPTLWKWICKGNFEKNIMNIICLNDCDAFECTLDFQLYYQFCQDWYD